MSSLVNKQQHKKEFCFYLFIDIHHLEHLFFSKPILRINIICSVPVAEHLLYSRHVVTKNK